MTRTRQEEVEAALKIMTGIAIGETVNVRAIGDTVIEAEYVGLYRSEHGVLAMIRERECDNKLLGFHPSRVQKIAEIVPSSFEVRFQDLAQHYGVPLDQRPYNPDYTDCANHLVKIWRDCEGRWHISDSAYPQWELLERDWAPQDENHAVEVYRECCLREG